MHALRKLKANNPLYVDIDIPVNDSWFDQSVAYDFDLFGGLLRQAEINTKNSSPDTAPQDHISDNSKSHSNAEHTITYAVPSSVAKLVVCCLLAFVYSF